MIPGMALLQPCGARGCRCVVAMLSRAIRAHCIAAGWSEWGHTGDLERENRAAARPRRKWSPSHHSTGSHLCSSEQDCS